MNFYHFQKKYRKKLLDIDRTRCSKNYFQKVVHKTCEFILNKTADIVTNSYNDKRMKTKPVEGILIPPEKTE